MSRIYLCLFLFLAVVSETALASVLAIDYGADWIKASLVQPGVPFDVLLNKDSKRKIQSSVSGNKRQVVWLGRIQHRASLFQKPLGTTRCRVVLTSISSADVVETSRGTVALRRSDGTEWSVEELIAMQFAYVKELAEAAAGEKRDAVVDAIEIAGLRTLALINDGTAVAVNYAMTRTFPTPEYHVIYDAGASAIRATVVSFASAAGEGKSKSAAKDGTQLSVLGVGYDRSLGGTELDRRLRELMISDFQRKHRMDIRSDRRGMAKLWKEAGRVKAILSANTDAMATVESVAFDVDYRSKISRADFEIACKDLKDNMHAQSSTLWPTLNNITSVILTGGSSRTPMIQAAVKAAVGEKKIALNVNADEAAVLGAALHGASLSRQFKTKDIKLSDIGVHNIQVSYPAEAKTPNVKPRTINTLVFPAGSKAGSRKTLTFKRTDDFSLTLSYRSPPVGFPADVLRADIVGISEAIQNLTNLGKLKGFFGGGSSSSADEAGDHTEGVVRDEQSSSSSAPAPSASALEKAPKQDTITLDVKVHFPPGPPMALDDKRRSPTSRLVAVDNEELGKRHREEARNALEGYLYRVRDLLEETGDTPFVKCSQDGERRRMAEKLQETLAWLHDYGDDADTRDYVEKRSAVEALERPVVHRYKEIEEFPQALNNSQMWNWSTRLFLTDARMNLTNAEQSGLPAKYTSEELDGLERTLIEHETWLAEWVERQKSVKMNEDPVILTSEMRARAKTLENHLQRLMKKKAPRPIRKSTSKASTAASSVSEGAPVETPLEDAPQHHEEL
ncbi:Hsp70 protein-domain-containing protein [Amylocystis lapponica]|nr:Hsp70 protein-domain-containing protein [Amylocystis lapponica]